MGSSATNTTRSVQSDNNAGDNDIAAHKQPTYLQLKDNWEGVHARFTLLNIQELVVKPSETDPIKS